VHASSDWNAGPDRPEPTMDEEVRDPA